MKIFILLACLISLSGCVINYRCYNFNQTVDDKDSPTTSTRVSTLP